MLMHITLIEESSIIYSSTDYRRDLLFIGVHTATFQLFITA